MNRLERRKSIRNGFKLGFGLIGKIQVVLSEPKWLLVGTYTTKSGQLKNRYIINLNSKPIKKIYHQKILN